MKINFEIDNKLLKRLAIIGGAIVLVAALIIGYLVFWPKSTFLKAFDKMPLENNKEYSFELKKEYDVVGVYFFKGEGDPKNSMLYTDYLIVILSIKDNIKNVNFSDIKDTLYSGEQIFFSCDVTYTIKNI